MLALTMRHEYERHAPKAMLGIALLILCAARMAIELFMRLCLYGYGQRDRHPTSAVV
jgi:hypothetical protein